MFLDLTKHLVDVQNDDEPLFEERENKDNPKEPKKVPVTAALMAIRCLMVSYKGEEELTGEKKLERYAIAMAIRENPADCKLTAEQVSELKKLVGKAYGPMLVGQILPILESPVEKPRLRAAADSSSK